ncbi:hypothetical protein [Acinetobacter haemolyticus]|uniref:hypothetical protein n=1 Tax=Acinetobacter haemolyticus TaxID=29430 RepID=UPI003F550C51
MSKKYRYRPIKTIKDWEGEDWDVYEERKSASGIMIYRGWLYSNKGGVFAYILTTELADFITQHGVIASAALLGISTAKISCFRRELNVQKKIRKLDHDWIRTHQDELLYESFQTLHDKYGLTQRQVSSYCRYLIQYAGVNRKKKERPREEIVLREQWYQQNKNTLHTMSLKEIQQNYDFSYNTARAVYQRICEEFQQPKLTYRERRKNWLFEHQQEIFRTDIEVKDIAQNLNQTERQIMYARKELKLLLANVGRRNDKKAWVEKHRNDLIELSISQLQRKYNLSFDQVCYRRKLLKQLKENDTKRHK